MVAPRRRERLVRGSCRVAIAQERIAWAALRFRLLECHRLTACCSTLELRPRKKGGGGRIRTDTDGPLRTSDRRPRSILQTYETQHGRLSARMRCRLPRRGNRTRGADRGSRTPTTHGLSVLPLPVGLRRRTGREDRTLLILLVRETSTPVDLPRAVPEEGFEPVSPAVQGRGASLGLRIGRCGRSRTVSVTLMRRALHQGPQRSSSSER